MSGVQQRSLSVKKLAIFAAAAVIAAAAGLSGAWFWGASRVTAAVDAQAAALQARGVTLGWGAREVGGFPWRYDLRLTDVALGAADGAWRLEIPWTLSVGALGGDGQVLTTSAPTATLDVTAPTGPLRFDVEMQGLAARSAINGPTRATWRAEALGVAHVAGAGVREGRLTATQVEGSLETLPGEATRAAVTIANLGATLDLDPALGGDGRTVAVAEGVSATARGDGPPTGWLAAARQGDGSADIEVRLRASRLENAAGDVSSSGATLVRLGLAEGRLTYLADAQAVRAGVALGPNGPRGAARAERVLAGVDVPVRAGPTAQAYTLRLTVDALTLEDALWGALDPESRLSRKPASLRGEIGGGAVVSGPSGAAPLQVETVTLRGIALDVGGASVRADGALTVIPGAPFPNGRLSLRATDWAPLLASAVDIGLIGPAMASDILDMAERLAAADSDVGVFESEIDLRDGAIWANGVRVR